MVKRLIILFYLLFLVNVTFFVCGETNYAYAHIPQGNRSAAPIEEWKIARDNIRIQFSYIPEKPLIYTETDLIFSIQDLATGNHIKDLVAIVTIIKNNKIFFKFNNVDIQDGDLSLRVQFLEDGNYQVISQIRSADNIGIALASFNIFVPLQPVGKFNTEALSSSLIPAVIGGIGLSTIVVAIILILRKREETDNTRGEERQKEGKWNEDR